MITHAVGHNAAFLGSGSDDIASGAHAEGVNPPSVFATVGQFVIRRAKIVLRPFLPVLRFIDKRLGMFYPYADGKRLLRHFHASLIQDAERIPRTVSDGQNQRFRIDLSISVDDYP